jgi:nucleotide-binding universal stress UspA family protein
MKFPFKKILTPITLDEHSLTALDLAARIAQRDGALMILLTVVEMENLAGGPLDVENIRLRAEIERKKLVQIGKRRLRGVKHEVVAKIGDPATAIVEAADDAKVDLIVMATHGREGIPRLVLGSVAERVVREAVCPVLSLHLGQPRKRKRNITSKSLKVPESCGPQKSSTLRRRER